jgi:tRNA modification GTPase
MRTIAAIATPPGISGLAVVRISGDDAIDIIGKCFSDKSKLENLQSHTIIYGKIYDNDRMVDTVTLSYFKTPNSYTGEDVIEIGCHGGLIIVNEILDLLYNLGATPAQPGEFTKRAFLNGKLDLAQVEAVADIIHAVSVPGTRTAARQLKGDFTSRLQKLRLQLLDISGLLELELDFAEEGVAFVERHKIIELINSTIEFCRNLYNSYRASEVLRSGFKVAIAGFPNSGKSTLFNSILGRRRAIVSEIAGTTRDYIEESLFIDGLKIIFTDTAGLRETEDIIEIEGIRLVNEILEKADLILVINDLTKGELNSKNLVKEIAGKYPENEILLLQNKVDLEKSTPNSGFAISAEFGTGIDVLKGKITEKASNSIERISDILINKRHYDLLFEAERSLIDAKTGLEEGMENELIAIDLRKATKILGELTGESWNEEVLDRIFSSFCIGK